MPHSLEIHHQLKAFLLPRDDFKQAGKDDWLELDNSNWVFHPYRTNRALNYSSLADTRKGTLRSPIVDWAVSKIPQIRMG